MRRVETSIEIHQPASAVFDAFVEPPVLKKWWGVESCLIEKKQGGLYSLAWETCPKGYHYVSTGIITVFIPGRELLIDHFVYFNPEKQILGPTYLSLKIEEANGNTQLHLVQGGYQQGGDWDWFYESVRDAWPKVLQDLKKFLNG
ncbi:MAG: SRPBCC domain-containing protein [Sphingobacteriales bacterium]|nr:SRPBCC domain-containing protein [Sphingobacteriales bacterium]